MTYSEDYFTAHDGLKIHTETWLPDGDFKAIVFVVHGYGEHTGRYHHVAELLVDANYGVFAIDHRGHGKSDGTRALFYNFANPIKDLRQFFTTVKQAHPDKKIFMIGHSMGSLITLEYTLQYQAEIAGIVISGTAINGGERVSAPLRAVANILRRISPSIPIQPPGPPTDLHRDPDFLAAYEKDDVMYKGWWKVGMASTLIEVGEDIHKRAQQLTLPILVMHGESDVVTPISGSHDLYKLAASTDKTIKTWPGMQHEIFNEIGREAVFDVMLNWLAAH